MPVLKRLQSYLDTNKIPYEVVSHPKAYTARDVAQTLDVPGKLVAKVVMVKADAYFVMSVLPSTWRVDMKRLRDVLEAREVRLATEAEIAQSVPRLSGRHDASVRQPLWRGGVRRSTAHGRRVHRL